MRVNVLFFASLADVVGSRRLTLELGEGATVQTLLDQIESSHPRIRAYRPVLLTAVNEEYVELSHAVAEGDEVAIFPPVSGGEVRAESRIRRLPREHYEITWNAIDSAGIVREFLAPDDGAVCIFEGVVRNNSRGRATRYLVYEAYEQMALKTLEEIGRRVRDTWEIDAIALVHRLGRIEIREASVAVIVTSPHRRAAFDACHYAIDRLKKIVPIWKKEYFEDGEVWIEGQP